MIQAYGYVLASGEILNGSGNFNIRKDSPGIFVITVDNQGGGPSHPVIVASPVSRYLTASAIVLEAGRRLEGFFFTISTGYTDQDSTTYEDVEAFTFVAFC